MIEFLSSFAKSVGLSIVIVSILEMILPNNKTKKYIRIVMGIFILFNIVSPFVNNKEIFNLSDIDFEKYYTSEANAKLQTEEINQDSMNKRIEELYVQELEKDIETKIKEKGYKVINCSVSVKIGNENEETKISKIKLNIEKDENAQKENVENESVNGNANENKDKNKDKNKNKNESLENKIVTEIQKIKKIDISANKKENEDEETKTNLDKSDIQNIKKFLIEEYGVSEECLQIN